MSKSIILITLRTIPAVLIHIRDNSAFVTEPTIHGHGELWPGMHETGNRFIIHAFTQIIYDHDQTVIPQSRLRVQKTSCGRGIS